jgi:hypothetical protein
MCGATVYAQDSKGRALNLVPVQDKCGVFVAWDGWEETFEITATKAGYFEGRAMARMEKLPCYFRAPKTDIELELDPTFKPNPEPRNPDAGADADAGRPD